MRSLAQINAKLSSFEKKNEPHPFVFYSLKDRLAIQRGGRVPIMGKVPLKTRPPEGAYCAVRLLSDLEDCLPKVWSLPIIHDL